METLDLYLKQLCLQKTSTICCKIFFTIVFQAVKTRQIVLKYFQKP